MRKQRRVAFDTIKWHANITESLGQPFHDLSSDRLLLDKEQKELLDRSKALWVIATKIRSCREQAGLSRRQLAELAKVSYSTIKKIECCDDYKLGALTTVCMVFGFRFSFQLRPLSS